MLTRVILAILTAIPDAIAGVWARLPTTVQDPFLWVWGKLDAEWQWRAQKAATDFWTYFTVGVSGLTFVLPDNGDWRNWLIALAFAIGGVALNALRRVTDEARATYW